jgi:hypothetical protein
VAEVLFRTDKSYREWVRELLGARLRAQYRKRVPPPRDAEERLRYEKEIESVVLGRLRQATPSDYVQYLADWLLDVRARDLALRLEGKEANLLLPGKANAADQVDMIQRRWLRLHDWLSLPDRVRVLVPLELVCDRDRERCGFYRIVLPRFGELPEDLKRVSGKVLRPRTLEEFIQYDMAKVPKYPFGLMWIRWLLGLPVQPGDPAPELSWQREELVRAVHGAGPVTAIEHHAAEVIPLETRVDKVIDGRLCFRRVTIDFDDVKLDMVVRIVAKERWVLLKPDEDAEQLHKCEAEEAVSVTPTCFYPGEPAALNPLEVPLAGLGVPVCQGT